MSGIYGNCKSILTTTIYNDNNNTKKTFIFFFTKTIKQNEYFYFTILMPTIKYNCVTYQKENKARKQKTNEIPCNCAGENR